MCDERTVPAFLWCVKLKVTDISTEEADGLKLNLFQQLSGRIKNRPNPSSLKARV